MKESTSYLFNQIAGAFWINMEKFLSSIGIHSGQVFVLISLWDNDGQSQAELVRNIQVSPPTIYNMIVRMTEAGFVETRKCSRDARLSRVFLTKKGSEIKSEVENQWAKLEETTFLELSETEKMMFHLLLKKLKKP